MVRVDDDERLIPGAASVECSRMRTDVKGSREYCGRLSALALGLESLSRWAIIVIGLGVLLPGASTGAFAQVASVRCTAGWADAREGRRPAGDREP